MRHKSFTAGIIFRVHRPNNALTTHVALSFYPQLLSSAFIGKRASRTPHKFKAQSARRNVISPLSSFHRLDRLVSFTSQVASALAFISRSVSA